MTSFYSKLGAALSVLYILICVYFISTQGLFGESFIAIILGLPLSALFSSFEFGSASGAFLYVMVLLPLAFNAFLLYWIGALLGKLKR